MNNIIPFIQQNMFFEIFWAIIIFIIGFLISKKIGDLVCVALKKIRLNQMMKNLGWVSFFEKYNTKLNAVRFFGGIVQTFFVLITLMISIEIIGLYRINDFIEVIINYYPNIFIASIIFIGTVFIADFSTKIIFASSEKENFQYSNAIGRIISTSAWILAILAILYQLQIVPDLILTLFIGVVIAIALIFGLSFGLGGKDIAKKFLEDTHKKVK